MNGLNPKQLVIFYAFLHVIQDLDVSSIKGFCTDASFSLVKSFLFNAIIHSVTGADNVTITIACTGRRVVGNSKRAAKIMQRNLLC